MSKFWVLLYITSTIMAVLINKYILWELHFTFPTVFQSWQMLVALCILLCSHVSTGKPNFLSLNTIKRCLPSVFFFTLAIYTGSKGLGKMPVPIFTFVQQLITLTFFLGWESRKSRTYPGCLTLLFVAIAFTCITVLTFTNDETNYKWVVVNSLSMVFYALYAVRLKDLQLDEIEKMIINSCGSIIILMLFGNFTNETFDALEFVDLYSRHFHLLCAISGILCGTIMLAYHKLLRMYSLICLRVFNCYAFLLAAVISMFIYKAQRATTVELVQCTAALLCVVIFTHLGARDFALTYNKQIKHQSNHNIKL